MCLVAGMQPSKAGPILNDEAGGMPQRFLWLMVADRYAPSDVVISPQPKILEIAHSGVMSDADPVVMDICHEAALVIDERAVRQLRGEYTDLTKSHWLQSKLRVAAVLALLHGVDMVTTEFWDVADWLMHKSDEGRIFCAHIAAQEREKEDRRSGRREGVKLLASDEVRVEKARDAARRIILKSVPEDGTWIKESNISRSMGKVEYREHMKELLGDLVRSGTLEQRRLKSARGRPGYVYRRS